MLMTRLGNVGQPAETNGPPMRTTTCEWISHIDGNILMKQTGTTLEMETGSRPPGPLPTLRKSTCDDILFGFVLTSQTPHRAYRDSPRRIDHRLPAISNIR
jgi:hypothetical protein